MPKTKTRKTQTKAVRPSPAKKTAPPGRVKFRSVYYYGIIMLLSFIVYGNTFRNDFAVDDKTLITGNQLVRQAKLGQLLTHGTYYGYIGDNTGAFRPLSMVYYSLLFSSGGGKPLLFHFFNVLLFALCAVLLFALLRHIFAQTKPAILLAAIGLFVVHPIHTEVVANIKNADELLCLAFALLSLLMWTRYLIGSGKKMLITSVVAYALSLMCKETAIAYLPVFACLVFVFAPAGPRRAFLPYVWFVVAFAGFMALRFAALSQSFSHSYLAINNSLYAIRSVPDLWATKIFLLGFYAFKMLWALPLSWDYSFGAIGQHTFLDVTVWLSFALLLLSLFVVVRYYKKEAVLSLGIVWFWALLLPASNTFILIESTFAERFLFSGSVGFLIVLIWIFSKLPLNGKKIYGAALVILMVIFAFQTIARNAQWKNDDTLVRCDIQHSDAVRIQMSYISDRFRKAEQTADPAAKNAILDSALNYSQKIQKMLPDYAEVNYLLARNYLYLQQPRDAETYYLSAVKLDPKHAKALNDLGVIYGKNHEYEKAYAYFTRALSADSTDYKAAENAGIEAFYLQKYDVAKACFDKALHINPASTVAPMMIAKIHDALKETNPQDHN